jgi:hypothetical protein
MSTKQNEEQSEGREGSAYLNSPSESGHKKATDPKNPMAQQAVKKPLADSKNASAQAGKKPATDTSNKSTFGKR